MRKRVLLLVVALSAALAGALSTGCAPGGAGSPVDYSADGGSLDSFGLIERALSAGRLDYSTGVLYKVYAAYEPMSLPEEYRSDVPLAGVSHLASEVQQNWNRLSEEHRTEISAYIQPVSDPDESDTGLDDVTPDRLEDERNRID